jgi:SAM-dependent methyltransferase
MADHFHEANRRRWDAGSASWARRADTRGIWRKCHLDPALALHPAELRWLSNVAGKRVAVLGSGDNQVVFALCGLGAEVTSVDISERQLEVARGRAAALGLAVEFVRADVVDLSCLAAATYDLVYTGGHVAVWVSDLHRHYAEAARILKPGGHLLISEYHPFRRMLENFRKSSRPSRQLFRSRPASLRGRGGCAVSSVRRIRAVRVPLDRRRLHLGHYCFRL